MGISIQKRPLTKGGVQKFRVDITYQLPGEHETRRYRKVPEGITTRTAATTWAGETLGLLLRAGPGGIEKSSEKVQVPTLAEFWPRFIENYAKANRQKASSVESKESIFRIHLRELAPKRLDAITNEDVQALKNRLEGKAPKTMNNVLSALGTALKVAVKWKASTGLAAMPCEVELVKVQKRKMEFYERDVLERLIVAAKKVDDRAELVVLLGAEAGLRAGEMVGLEWGDVDLKRYVLTVNRNVWRGQSGPPKGGNSREIDLTLRLLNALKARRSTSMMYAGNCRVLCAHVLSERVDHWQLRNWMAAAQKLAGISTGEVHKGKHRGQRDRGRLHVLRHTFVSNLVMAGVQPYVIQELAGHANLTTTMGYMHLAKGSKAEAIEKLERWRTAG